MSAIVDPTEFVISTSIEVERAIAGLPAASAALLSSLRSTGNQASKALGDALNGAISGAFKGGLGATGFLGGLGLAVRGIAQLQGQIQDANVGIASLLSANTGEAFATSLERARGVVRDLQEDARAGVGNLEDYRATLQTILVPGLQAGGSLARIRELNRLAVAGGTALRGQPGARLAGEDIRQALEGQVSQRTTPIVGAALTSIGVSFEEFRRLTQPQRFDTLLRAFQTFEAGAEAFGQTFGAQVDTLQDNFRSIATTLTSPVFESWTTGLRRVNQLIDRTRDSVSVVTARLAPNFGAVLGGVAGAGAGGLVGAGVGGGVGTALGGALGTAIAGPLGTALGGALGGALGTALGGAGGAIGGLGVVRVIEALVNALRRLDSEAVSRWLSSFEALGLVISEALDALINGASVLRPVLGGLAKAFVDTAEVQLRLSTLLIGSALDVSAAIGKIVSAFTALGPQGALRFLTTGGRLEEIGQNLQQDLSNRFAQFRFPTEFVGPLPGQGGGEGLDQPVVRSVTNFNGPVRVEVRSERVDDPLQVVSTFERALELVEQFPTTSSAGRFRPAPA